jgi:hypothetical protein
LELVRHNRRLNYRVNACAIYFVDDTHSDFRVTTSNSIRPLTHALSGRSYCNSGIAQLAVPQNLQLSLVPSNRLLLPPPNLWQQPHLKIGQAHDSRYAAFGVYGENDVFHPKFDSETCRFDPAQIVGGGAFQQKGVD